MQVLHSNPFWFVFTGLLHTKQGYFQFGIRGEGWDDKKVGKVGKY